jgi:hypothetical protein
MAELKSVARQCREYAVLSVRPRLRANGVIVGDDMNALHPRTNRKRWANDASEVHCEIQP